MRKRDVVLMATVTSFEALSNPSRLELKQFSELFRPLFENSGQDARRQAVAALSRLSTLPQAVCFFIGAQPINVAALFLSQSPSISDQTLIDIARSQGEAHARVIATRASLSPIVVDALASLHHGSGYRNKLQNVPEEASPKVETPQAPAVSPTEAGAEDEAKAEREAARLAREEALREELKLMVSGAPAFEEPPARHARPLTAADDTQSALLVRFARERQMLLFSRVLSEALDASGQLAERILLDISGLQLSTTLIALGCRASDIRTILTAIYPHLAQIADGRNRAYNLVRSLDPTECVERVVAWRRADIYTRSGLFEDVEADMAAQAAVNGNQPPAPMPQRALRG
jgi:uncharacterized protein (DUF2336 family)